MIGIIDYGAGNTGNVRRALDHLRRENRLCPTPDSASGCDLLILPGVGAFPPAMDRLTSSGWSPFLIEWASQGKPLLGICLGMQLLCESSLEDRPTRGLGLINGTVSLLEGTKRLPHMGWNSLAWMNAPERIQEACPDGTFLYFVHSYALMDSAHTAAVTEVDQVRFISVVRHGRVMGCQFHPERSGSRGLKLLSAILEELEGKG